MLQGGGLVETAGHLGAPECPAAMARSRSDATSPGSHRWRPEIKTPFPIKCIPLQQLLTLYLSFSGSWGEWAVWRVLHRGLGVVTVNKATPTWRHLSEWLQEIEKEGAETVYTTGQQTFSVKEQIVNILAFRTLTASVKTTQL